MSLPKTYKKLFAMELGWDFMKITEWQDVDVPELGENDIAVKNLYAGVNASDVNASKGSHGLFEAPAPVGIESLGEVVADGEKVCKFKLGDFCITMERGGGYSEYVFLPARNAIAVPEASPEILSVVVSGLSASLALIESGEMKDKQNILITAAAGAVGQFAVQIAKQAGNYVIGTCSSEEKRQHLLKLGCDEVINYKTQNLDAVLTEKYPQGINLIIESVGQEVFDTCVKHLAVKGMLVVLGYTTEYKRDEVEKVEMERIYTQLLFKSATIRGFLFSDFISFFKEHTNRLIKDVSEGRLIANIDPEKFEGIESVKDAVLYVQEGKNCGKVIVKYDRG